MNYNTNANPTIKSLQIIHGALCAGPVLFLAVTSFINTKPVHTDITAADQPLLFVGILMAGISPVIGSFLFNKQVKSIDQSLPVSQRFQQYITACLIRYALLEGAALLNIVAWFLTANLIPAVIAVVLIGLMIYFKPVKSTVIADLGIGYPDTLD